MRALTSEVEVTSVNYLLSSLESSAGGRVFGKVEAYTCKRLAGERRSSVSDPSTVSLSSIGNNSNSLEIDSQESRGRTYSDSNGRRGSDCSDNSGSFSQSPILLSMRGNSPAGDATQNPAISKKVLLDLVQVLNLSFPDYDFSSSAPDNFTRESSFDAVATAVDEKFASYVQDYELGIKPLLWRAMESVLTELREVEVYSYVPDGPETNPFTEEETTWSMNYFFYHKRRRTIVFLYVYAAQAAHLADQNADRRKKRSGRRKSSVYDDDDSDWFQDSDEDHVTLF